VLDKALVISRENFDSIIDIDDALSRLTSKDPGQGRIVELRYFGGLTAQEAAEVLNVSLNTVKREWSGSRAWLHGEPAGKPLTL
jgi:RNA polymerase sigma-70 factor (ECF subfamily)